MRAHLRLLLAAALSCASIVAFADNPNASPPTQTQPTEADLTTHKHYVNHACEPFTRLLEQSQDRFLPAPLSNVVTALTASAQTTVARVRTMAESHVGSNFSGKSLEARMSKKKKAAQSTQPFIRDGAAKAHAALVDEFVHVFVDDQNLFWGLLNNGQSQGYRIDFGRMLTAASKDVNGKTRYVKSAYIAGVIPDDDSFWKMAQNQGFNVRRGYLSGAGGQTRSKQDDAFLITEITSTLYEQKGPSTIVLVAGDADYVPPLIRANEKGWRVEVAFIERGLSSALDPVTHLFRTITASSIEYLKN
jgi:uncharacterized LabA/DUF88 family protein